MRTKIFYFDGSPEEMYYVTFVNSGAGENPNYSRLAIRGVENGNGKWKKFMEFNTIEQERIEKRFEKEIISRLEHFTRVKSYVEKTNY